MHNQNWKNFWENFKNIEAKDEADLFVQVGKTDNQKPINQEFFEAIVQDIQQNLALDRNDILLEMCCGNGLFTYPLSFLVKEIYAFDFTELLIDTAKIFKARENITYAIGDAKGALKDIFDAEPHFNKFLMNDATAYFQPGELANIFEQIANDRSDFRFYLTNIPNDEKKWNFYNTPERKERYENFLKNGDYFLGGIGRWWKYGELEEIGHRFNLKVKKSIYRDPRFSYRMNVLFYR